MKLVLGETKQAVFGDTETCHSKYDWHCLRHLMSALVIASHSVNIVDNKSLPFQCDSPLLRPYGV